MRNFDIQHEVSFVTISNNNASVRASIIFGEQVNVSSLENWSLGSRHFVT